MNSTEKNIDNNKIEQIKKFRENALIDLHTHTCYSDGDLNPNELIKLAFENNVGTLAITDHNTILGLKNIEYQSEEASYVKVIPGIELSAKVPKGKMHVLGYNLDINNSELNKKIIQLRNDSINNVLSIIEQIKKDYGIIFTYEEIKELVNLNHNLGRPDIAKLCVKNGYAENVQDAFDKYLIDAYNKTRKISKRLSYEECLQLILNSGGVPVLAHPKSLGLNDKEFLILIKDMINCGLKGIEVYHSTHSEGETDYYLSIAQKYGLLTSGGSDYHGYSVKPDIKIGTGKNGNVKIKKLSLLDHIES